MRSLTRPVMLTWVLCMASNGCGGPLDQDDSILAEGEALTISGFCTRTSDCPSGKSCVFNQCVSQPGGGGYCLSDMDCPVGQTCTGKQCSTARISPFDPPKVGCTYNSGCASWQVCQAGVCRVKPGRCLTSGHCGRAYVCKNTYCVKGPFYCDTSSDCSADRSCVQHLCEQKQCTSNAACPAGFYCQLEEGDSSRSCGKAPGRCKASPYSCGTIDSTGYASYTSVRSPSAVRGCDSKYYKSATAAHCAGVSVMSTINCHACTSGAKRCVNDTSQRCTADADGCRAWQHIESCADYCSGGICQTCNDACSYVGQKVCSGDNLKVCKADSNGCLKLETKQACTYECKSGACTASPTQYTKTASFLKASCGYSVCYDYAKPGQGVCASRNRIAKVKKITNNNSLGVDLAYYQAAADYFAPKQSRWYPDIPLSGTWYIYPYSCSLSGSNACPTALSVSFTYWCKRK